jgi:hypothetical protein
MRCQLHRQIVRNARLEAFVKHSDQKLSPEPLRTWVVND